MLRRGIIDFMVSRRIVGYICIKGRKMRLDALPDASRRIQRFVKARFIKHQGLF